MLRATAGLALRRTDRQIGGALGGVRGARRAARRRGHDAGREPDRVGAEPARLLADGGGGAALQHAAARHDLEDRVAAASPKLCVGEEELLAELPGGVPTMTMAEVAAVLDEDRPQETPAAIAEMDARPGAHRLHLGHDRGAARRRPPLPLPVRAAGPGRALVRLAPGELAWCTDRDRLVEVGPQRLPRPLDHRRRRGHPRRSLRPGRAARLRRGAGVNVLCQAPTEYRMLAAASCGRCQRCGGWSPPESRSTRR